MKAYLMRWARWLTQSVNLLTGGSEDVHFSTRCYLGSQRSEAWSFSEGVVNRVFWWQKDERGSRNHCERSFRGEIARMAAFVETNKHLLESE